MRVPGLTMLTLAVGSLLERPMRTVLTMLGVIIGVAAVYTTLSIGEGTRQRVQESLDSVAGRTITVYPNWGGGRASRRGAWKPFTERDVEDIQGISGVYAATGEIDSEYPIVSETSDWSASVVGVDPVYLKAKDMVMERGRPITQTEVDRRDTVAVVGQSVVQSLFQGQDPIGQRIKIRNIPFDVIGVVGQDSTQSWGGRDTNNFVLVPRTTGRSRLFGDDRLVRNQVRSIVVVGESQAALTRIEREVDFIMRRSRGLTADEAPDFRIFNFSANRQANAATDQVIGYAMAILGAVALLVGGVGVMNIMLVSVSERTREIGLRMAIGARGSDILSQFLLEAFLLSFAAGILGLIAGHFASGFLLAFMKIELTFAPYVALLAFGSALFIGVLFGFLPAHRASKLNPIEALRHE